MSGKFYVYEPWRPDTGVCFYVGKGQGKRAFDMRRGRNRWHRSVTTKLLGLGLSVEIRIVDSGLQESEAFLREIERIAHWREQGFELVNLSDGGEGPSGLKHTEEFKIRVSEKLKGREFSPEHRAKLSAFMKGRQHGLGKKRPQYAIDASASAQRGIKRTPEVIGRLRAIRLANPTFKGKTHTNEWRERMRDFHMGVPKSEKAKARMRKPKSEAHKQKLREINLGKTHTVETRAKLSAITKALWARRKAENDLLTAQQVLAFKE